MTSRARSLLAVLCLFATASAFAGFAGTDLFLPNVGRQAGVFPSNWYTTVWIYNPGADAVTARLFLLERNTANPSPPFVDVLVAPDDTEKIENVVETLFNVEVFGALRVTAPEKLVVTSRVFSKAVGADDRDSVGQDFAAVPASFAIGAGESAQVLGAHQTIPAATSDFRFNFGFVETTGHTVTVRVTAFDGNNAEQGFKDFTVREFSQRQVAFKDHFPAASTENTRLKVEVIAGTGRIIAYGSGIANASQDPTTFEMQYRDSLLGIVTVQHDATLTGDGTAGAPLGIANAAVTLAKIGTTNSPAPAPALGVPPLAAGTPNVLTTDGVALSWQPASDGDITAVTAGTGLTGGAASGDAMLGIADSGIANSLLGANAVTADKIAGGQVVKSLNGLKDDVTLAASGTVTITPSGNTLTIGSTGLTLPYEGSAAVGGSGAAFKATKLGDGAGVLGVGFTGVAGVGSADGGFGIAGYNFSNTGTGVFGEGASNGVSGHSSNGRAVYGYSGDGTGVYGSSSGGGGVQGASDSYWAVVGDGGQGGVWGSSANGTGVQGNSNGGYGVSGTGGLSGVLGNSNGGYGVSGTGGLSGVLGTSANGRGVYGVSNTGNGVQGSSGGQSNGGIGGNGVYGYSFVGQGIGGESPNGYGVFSWGNMGYTGSLAHYSDERMKRDVSTLVDALEVVLALRGVSFTWRRDEFPEQHLNDGPQIGFIAQEVEPVLPEIVITDLEGLKAIDYSMLTPLLVEAIKQQQAVIESQQTSVAELRSALAALTAEVRDLSADSEAGPGRGERNLARP